MRKASILLLLLVACDTGEIARPSSGTVVYPSVGDDHRGESKVPSTPFPMVLVEAGVDACTDAGTDAPVDSGTDAADADVPSCETGTTVVGHCLFNMATACQEYFSDHSVECSDLDVHPMGGTWWSGPCGGEPGTDLVRSSGGCQDECGSIHWSYRLGGSPPDDVSRQGWKDSCESFPGRTYIPVP